MTRWKRQVMGIVGSPRKGGNTDILVDTVLQGAREAGAEVEKIMLADLKIAPCLACYRCRKSGRCIQRDDMARLLEKMKKSQVWVIGTPIYWWGPSAQTKAFMDRWFAKIWRKTDLRIFEGKRIILALPMGESNPKTARHVIGMFKDALAYVSAELYGSVLAAGAYEKGNVRSMPKVLRRARRLGRGAVKLD